MTEDISDCPEVTILMPVYNGSRFLRRQVDSIVSQESVDLRIVLLDDASTDNSLSIMRDLAEEDPRISIVTHSVNRGLMSTVYHLLGFVGTPYFALSDQDDVWDSNKIIDSIALLKQSGSKLVYSDVRIIDAKEAVVELSYWKSRGIRPIDVNGFLQLAYRNPIVGHTIVATADVAESVKPYPRGLLYYEAWLASTALNLGSISYSEQQLGSYRVHSSNVVGPQGTRALTKIRSKIKQPEKIFARQQQRVAALAALSHYSAEYMELAKLYQRNFFPKLFNSPKVIHRLTTDQAGLGKQAVLKELLFYLLVSTKRVDLDGG